GSLQHHGENVLSLARVLGNADLEHLDERDSSFFSFAPGVFAHYSNRWNWPLVILSVVGLVFVMFSHQRKAETTWLGVAAGFLFGIVLVLACVVIGLAFVCSIEWLHRHLLADGSVLQGISYFSSMLALMAAVALGIYGWLTKKATRAAISLG